MKEPFSVFVRFFLLVGHWPAPHEEEAATLIEAQLRRAARQAA